MKFSSFEDALDTLFSTALERSRASFEGSDISAEDLEAILEDSRARYAAERPQMLADVKAWAVLCRGAPSPHWPWLSPRGNA